MENTKITYAQALTKIREFAIEAGYEDTDVLDKVQAAIDSYGKRKSSSGKNAEANKALAEEIVANITSTPMTCSELIKSIEALNGLNTQRVAPILSNLADEGRIVKGKEKGKVVYSANA